MKSVSVILPLYNSESFVLETINSVLRQTHSRLELIVVDDCSTDSSLEIANRVSQQEPRVTCLSTKRNSGGPATPRNLGLSRATGEYIAFIDSDDLWHREKLTYQLSMMEHLDLDFSSTKMKIIHSSNEVPLIHELNLTTEQPRWLTHSLLLKKNIIANSSVMVTNKIASTLRFSEIYEHVAIEDYLAWLQLHQNAQLRSALLPESTLYYRSRPESLSRAKLAMARKIFRMLGQYQINGQHLGLKKYYYFLTYVINSLR